MSMFRSMTLDRQSLVLQIVSSMADQPPSPEGIPPHIIPRQR